MTEVAIKVSHADKNFILPHERRQSIKRVFTGLFSKRARGFEVQHALKDVSFEVKKGEFFGIVGRNGSGKSTLLKMLAGIYQPTAGTITVDGKLVPFIELGVGFNSELTGRENVYLNGALLGFSKKQIDAQYDGIVAFAELERFMDQKLKNYSSGMQVRLAFSLATRAQADILLVDEVLAVGDAAFQRKCFEYFKELKANKKTVVFVTHDMNAVREYCDRAMLIDKSEVQSIGSAQDISREYAMLFMEKASEHAKKGGGKRWGNGDAYVKDITTKLEDDEVVIVLRVHADRPVDKLVYGLHIMGQDGEEITAMNNRMIQAPDIEHVQPGQDFEITWRVLNVFNDGNYQVMLTLIDDVANTLDWWVRADTFTVKRLQRSTTAVLPPVSVDAKLIKNRGT
jgi:ABC-2 type transport system ATP-binding protein